MPECDDLLVATHYDRGTPAAAVVDAILEGLRAAGHDLRRLSWQDLEHVDQLHAGGGEATLALARLAGIRRDQLVLDVGGGIGGSARALAATYGCRVMVLDLAEQYILVGEALTHRLAMDGLVTFQLGDALSIPLEASSVDVAWTQHSTMNIRDRARLYAELHRVTRAGGTLAMHEIIAGDNEQPLHFPVPWAPSPEISFITTASTMRATIAEAGFIELAWNDVTVSALSWMRGQAASAAASDRPPHAPSLLLGAGFADAFRNIRRNLEEGRVAVVQAVFRRP